jgi:hypothetical protein
LPDDRVQSVQPTSGATACHCNVGLTKSGFERHRKETAMALRAEFTALPSGFDGFLFASIGEEESGAPLSVISALVRAGFDPWRESERLSKMPREAARDVLASLISRVRGSWTAADVPGITARLITLLPARDSERAAISRIVPAAGELVPSNWAALLIVLAGAAFLMWSIGG